MEGLQNFLKYDSQDWDIKELINAILRRIDSTGEGIINFKDFLKFLASNTEPKTSYSFKQKRKSKIQNEYSLNLFQKSIEFLLKL